MVQNVKRYQQERNEARVQKEELKKRNEELNKRIDEQHEELAEHLEKYEVLMETVTHLRWFTESYLHRDASLTNAFGHLDKRDARLF